MVRSVHIRAIKKTARVILIACSLLLYTLSTPHAVRAQDDCSEDNLRDLGVIVLDCEGTVPVSCGEGGSSALIGSDNQERIFNFFTGKGLTPELVAGIIGNMIEESGLEPKKYQGYLNAGEVYGSEEVSSGTVPPRGDGWGLVQWTPSSKIIDTALDAGIDFEEIDTLEFQLEFLWNQLNGTAWRGNPDNLFNEKGAGNIIFAAQTVEEAAILFGKEFERFKGSKDLSNSGYVLRIDNAKSIPLGSSSSGSASTSNGCSPGSGTAGASGLVSPEGYSFPLEPQTRAVGGVEVGQTGTIHHDGTPAFDLFSTDSAAVYAIFDGRAETVNTSYKTAGSAIADPGCSSVQFKADDGFYYWYGHIKNVTIQEGEHVVSGTKIAEVADGTNFTEACWGGGPHLHIDRGCVIGGVPQTAGRKACRDPDFIPFLSKLYEEL